MYGVTVMDAQPSFSVSDNPIYTRPNDIDQRQQDDVGFSNPMYESFKPKQDNEEEDDTGAKPDTVESHYQVPVSISNEKKKKKKEKKNKGKSKNDDDNENSMPDLSSFNPMFASREVYNDSGDENLYAVPNKQDESASALTGNYSGMDDTGSQIYATPRKGDNTDGVSNPLYDSRKDENEAEEDIPADIVSAFGFSPAQRLDGTSGQSDC